MVEKGNQKKWFGSPVPLSLLGSLAFYWAQRHEVAVLGAVDASTLPQSALSLFGRESGSAQLHGFLCARRRRCGVCRGRKVRWRSAGGRRKSSGASLLSRSRRQLSVLIARAMKESRSERSLRGGQLVLNDVVQTIAEGVDQGGGVPATVSRQGAELDGIVRDPGVLSPSPKQEWYDQRVCVNSSRGLQISELLAHSAVAQASALPVR